MNLTRLRRLLRLVALLQAGRGYNANALAVECEVSRRTIFRDLEVLRQAGVPIDFNDQEVSYRIAGRYLTGDVRFNHREALALAIFCNDLGAADAIPFQSAAKSAFLKLHTSLQPAERSFLSKCADHVVLLAPQLNHLKEKEELFGKLLEAVAARKSIRLLYGSLTEWTDITTKVQPYKLVFVDRSWYVVGRSSLHRQVRTFNVARIIKLDLLDDTFTIPRGFSLKRYFGNAWRMIPGRGKAQRVRNLFDQRMAQNVAEVTWHATQKTRMLPDGKLEFEVSVSGLEEISWWIMRYGHYAEVLEPQELREMLTAHFRQGLGRYEPSEAPLKAALPTKNGKRSRRATLLHDASNGKAKARRKGSKRASLANGAVSPRAARRSRPPAS